MGKQSKKLGEILIENGVLTEDLLNSALEIQKKEGGLIGEILLKNGFVTEKDVVAAVVKQRDYIYVIEESAVELLKKKIFVIVASLFLAIIFLSISDFLPLAKNIDSSFYGALLNAEYALRRPPRAINDILLVTIDNETLERMPYKWPYSRSDFVTVIENLKKYDPRVIAFDFAFYGKSDDPENVLLQNTLKSDPRIVTAIAINQHGELDFSNTLATKETAAGIITKLQDQDEIIRRCLTYMASGNKNDPNRAFLSWEMQILSAAKGIDLKSFSSEASTLKFRNQAGKAWVIPVDADTKSFLIHFRARTRDFKRISFYRVLKGDFDPWMVKNKIVMIGVASALLQDMQHTSIGWTPGIALNANAFLTLYTRDFLKNAPRLCEYIVLVIGVTLTAFFMTVLSFWKTAVLILIEIISFLALSYIFLLRGYIWNYALFILAILTLPLISKKIVFFLKPA